MNMRLFRHLLVGAAVVGAALRLPAAPLPQAVLTTSATNLTVTESYRITVTVTAYAFSGRLERFSPFPENDSPFGDMDPFSRGGQIRLEGTLPVENCPFKRTTRREGSTWILTLESEPIVTQAAGPVTLGPLAVRVPMRTGEVVNGFFGAELRTTVRRFELKPVTLTVNAPPLQGQPASYCGGIGSNFVVQAKLDTQVCTAGDPLVLTLDITGSGDLARLHPPQLAPRVNSPAFRVDDASAKTETRGTHRLFTWRVRALQAGTREFPALPFSWYDSATRRYATVTTEPIPVQVKAGAQVTLGAETAEPADEDVYPSPDGLDLTPDGWAAQPLLPHLDLVCVLFLLPPVLFFLVRLVPPVRRHLARRQRRYREKTAYARCRRALKSSRAARRQRALQDFFTTRYGVNGATVTAADAARLMAPDYSPGEIAVFTQALSREDSARFAGNARIGLVAFLLLGTALGLQADPTPAAASPEFTWHRANMLALRASDKASFAAARDAYLDCLHQGAETPALYANLGACALLAEDARVAEAAFAALERRTGETPTSRRGLLAARAHLTANPRAELSPVRLLLKPHVAYTLDFRLLVAACSWAFLWLVVLLPPGALRKLLFTLGVLVFMSTALSTAVSAAGEVLDGKTLHVQK